MQLMVLIVYGFAALSALMWLYAVVFNLAISVIRCTSDHLVRISTVWLVGSLAGLLAYFSSYPLWQGWSAWWLILIATPDIIAIISDGLYYRKDPVGRSSDSDNPKP